MTKAGVPTSRMHKSLLKHVLGPEFPSDFSYGGRKRIIPMTQRDQLVSLVERRAEELSHCARLQVWITTVVREFAGDKGLDPALKKVREDGWAPLAVELWTAGVDSIEGVREAVIRRLGDASVALKDLTAVPEFIQELEADLAARWPAPVPSTPPASFPLDMAYRHNDVPEETWEAAVKWVREHEDWGWAEEMQLVGDVTRRPVIQGPKMGTRPLDRSVEARASQQLRPGKQSTDLHGLTAEEVLRREVECAVAPFGVAALEARAVLMLGFWLVNNRDFQVAPGERLALPEIPADDDPISRAIAAERRELIAYHALLPRIWRNIRTQGRRKSDGVPDAEGVGGQDLDIDTEGRRRLADPLRTFMKRLWSRVHTYSHRGPITAEGARNALQYVWVSWVADVSTVMAKEPAAETGGKSRTDRSALAKHVHSVGTSGDFGMGLIRKLLVSDDPDELRSDWEEAVAAAGISERSAQRSGIGDPQLVRKYLLEQMRLLDEEEEEGQ